MGKKRRWLVPVVVVMMVMGAAGTSAGKPACPGHPSCKDDPPPDDGPVLVDVTMTLVNGQGLTTDCDGDDGVFGDDGDGIDGSIEMLGSPGTYIDNPGGTSGYSLEAVRDPVLGVYMNDVQWNRIYPDPEYGASGTGFTGCHRMLLDPLEPEALYGALFFDIDDSGAVADILWHFDYWYVWGERGSKKRPTPYVVEFEQFTLSMDETTRTWVDNTPGIIGDTNGVLTASFGMFYHLQGEGYQPLPGSPQTMSFEVVVVPRG